MILRKITMPSRNAYGLANTLKQTTIFKYLKTKAKTFTTQVVNNSGPGVPH